MKKLNNKGFSLVELIIVIAIMVILVVVIAPQYTKFVNNSKVAADVQTAQAMATAIDVAVAEGKEVFDSGVYKSTLTDPVDLSNTISKLVGSAKNGSNFVWTIKGDNEKGVESITLKYKDVDYDVYPNPDKGTTGLNSLKK